MVRGAFPLHSDVGVIDDNTFCLVRHLSPLLLHHAGPALNDVDPGHGMEDQGGGGDGLI